MTAHAGVREMALPPEYIRWRDTLNGAIDERDRSAWKIGDLFAAGEAAFGELAFAELKTTKIRRRTLVNYANVCRKFPPERRKWDLSISHYDAVKALPIEVQDEALQAAVEGGITRDDLRDALIAMGWIEEPPKPHTTLATVIDARTLALDTELPAGWQAGARVSVTVRYEVVTEDVSVQEQAA